MADATVDEKTKEPLFDVLIPPGVPRSILKEVILKYNVQLVERRERMSFANMEGDARDLLAFRGKRETIEQVEKFMLQRLKEFVEK